MGKEEEDVGSRLMRDTSCRRGSRPEGCICLEAGAKNQDQRCQDSHRRSGGVARKDVTVTSNTDKPGLHCRMPSSLRHGKVGLFLALIVPAKKVWREWR